MYSVYIVIITFYIHVDIPLERPDSAKSDISTESRASHSSQKSGGSVRSLGSQQGGSRISSHGSKGKFVSQVVGFIYIAILIIGLDTCICMHVYSIFNQPEVKKAKNQE